MSNMDHLLTPAQKRAKTRERKKQAMLEQMGVDTTPKKVKRKRKPMSEEQRQAAAERLALAREKRNKGKTPNVHPNVLTLDEDHVLSYKNSKETLKFWKEKLRTTKSQKDSKDSSLRQEYQIAETYVKNLNIWLRDGVYLDRKGGVKRDVSVHGYCVVPAKDKDGNIKRTEGIYYSDIDCVWTREMQKELAG